MDIRLLVLIKRWKKPSKGLLPIKEAGAFQWTSKFREIHAYFALVCPNFREQKDNLALQEF